MEGLGPRFESLGFRLKVQSLELRENCCPFSGALNTSLPKIGPES